MVKFVTGLLAGIALVVIWAVEPDYRQRRAFGK